MFEFELDKVKLGGPFEESLELPSSSPGSLEEGLSGTGAASDSAPVPRETAGTLQTVSQAMLRHH